MKYKNTTLVTVLLFLVISCQNQQKTEFDLVRNLNNYAKIIDSRKGDDISKICTKKGFNSILEWSDSLRDVQLLKSITNTFSSKRIVFSQPNNFTYRLETEPFKRKVVGESVGEITLILKNGKLKIDSYSGGYVVN